MWACACLVTEKKVPSCCRRCQSTDRAMISTAREKIWDLNRFGVKFEENFVIRRVFRFVFFVSRRAAPTSPWSSRWAVSCRSACSGDVVTSTFRRGFGRFVAVFVEATGDHLGGRVPTRLGMSQHVSASRLQKVELSHDVNHHGLWSFMMLKLIFMFKFQEFKAIFGLYLSVSLEAGAGERTNIGIWPSNADVFATFACDIGWLSEFCDSCHLFPVTRWNYVS